jgi:hypothetical protein
MFEIAFRQSLREEKILTNVPSLNIRRTIKSRESAPARSRGALPPLHGEHAFSWKHHVRQ